VHNGPSLMDEWPPAAVSMVNDYMKKRRLTIISFIYILFK
jgi:hypothetical protein